MIIIPGESIAALDRIGSVRLVPDSRYPGYNADTRRRGGPDPLRAQHTYAATMTGVGSGAALAA